MNLTKIDQKISKSFSLKTIFAFSVLLAMFASMTFDKTIKFLIKVFKIMHFNNARTITVDDV